MVVRNGSRPTRLRGLVAFGVALVPLAVPFAAHAKTYFVNRDQTVTAPPINDPMPAGGWAISSNPSTFSGLNLNTFLGADRFYANGVTGQGTISYNVEAGHVWNGHEALAHVTTQTTGPGALGEFDRHATWCGLFIGGRNTAGSTAPYQTGLAAGTDLRSGAFASTWNGTRYSLGFSYSFNALFNTYLAAFGTADVINSSWGTTDTSGTGTVALGLDGLARSNPRTTFVASAGNSGPTANTIGGPASGSNSIAVGALGDANAYNTVASFSSRGPQDYADPVNGLVVSVRAAVDVSAPGENLTSAYYGGETGGNRPALGGSPGGNAGGPNFYSGGIGGTSFAAPIVAGAVSLLDSAARNRPALSGNANARDARVVKAVLLNSADKTAGWTNGQSSAAGVVRTTQSLDWAVGAGRINLDRAYDQLLSGTTDVPGTGGGIVGRSGWDYGSLSITGTSNDYVIGLPLAGGTLFTATLDWFRDRSLNPSTLAISDTAFRNLDLEIWDATFTTLIAASESVYNDVEHLNFTVPTTGLYGIRVSYDGNVFGPTGTEPFGLAWTAVPEPAASGVLGLAVTAGLLVRRRRARPAAVIA
jgi:hypothetical protein